MDKNNFPQVTDLPKSLEAVREAWLEHEAEHRANLEVLKDLSLRIDSGANDLEKAQQKLRVRIEAMFTTSPILRLTHAATEWEVNK